MAVIVIHYGRSEPTAKLLLSIQNYDATILVVSNDLSERPRGLPEGVQWLIPVRNLGYGEGFNWAVSQHDADVYVLLNTDIELGLACFNACVDALLNSEGVGISAPVLRFADGSLQSGAAELTRYRRAPRPVIEPATRDNQECTWVTGAVMFVSGQLARAMPMDGSYFLGAEDADYCLRARKQGFRVVICGGVEAIHHESQTITRPVWYYYSVRNRVWFTRARFGHHVAVLNWVFALCMLPRVFAADLCRRRGFVASRLTLLGLRHALRRKPSPHEGPWLAEPVPLKTRWLARGQSEP